MKNSHSIAIVALTAIGVLCIGPALWSQSNQRLVLASSYQMQETTVFLDFEDLADPHFLRISPNSSLSSLSGSVSCNGSIIQLLGDRTTQINLSPYLRQGRNDVSIVGKYSPTGTSIDVELTGPSNQVNQSTSGSGALNQRIVIDVQ